MKNRYAILPAGNGPAQPAADAGSGAAPCSIRARGTYHISPTILSGPKAKHPEDIAHNFVVRKAFNGVGGDDRVPMRITNEGRVGIGCYGLPQQVEELTRRLIALNKQHQRFQAALAAKK